MSCQDLAIDFSLVYKHLHEVPRRASRFLSLKKYGVTLSPTIVAIGKPQTSLLSG
jgi:hypothetical protein